jgi:predicted DNA-binding protein (MmcQ/YjbR family)
MNLETYYEYCLSKIGVTEHFPLTKILYFKSGRKNVCIVVFKSMGKGQPSVNLKCDPERANYAPNTMTFSLVSYE